MLYETFGARSRFEEEAKGNSEMACGLYTQIVITRAWSDPGLTVISRTQLTFSSLSFEQLRSGQRILVLILPIKTFLSKNILESQFMENWFQIGAERLSLIRAVVGRMCM